MPQTVVRAPNGLFITVNHPEGAAQEEIYAYADQLFRQRGFDPTAELDDDAFARANDARTWAPDRSLTEMVSDPANKAASTLVGVGATALDTATGPDPALQAFTEPGVLRDTERRLMDAPVIGRALQQGSRGAEMALDGLSSLGRGAADVIDNYGPEFLSGSAQNIRENADTAAGLIAGARERDAAAREREGRLTLEQERGATFGRAVQDRAAEMQRDIRANLSEETLADEQFVSRTMEGSLPEIGMTLINPTNWLDIANAIGPETAAYMLPGMGASRLAAATGAGARAGLAVNTQTQAALISAGGAEEVAASIRAAPIEALRENPEFQQLVADGMPEEQARAQLADRGYNAALAIGLPLNAAAAAGVTVAGLNPVDEIAAAAAAGRAPTASAFGQRVAGMDGLSGRAARGALAAGAEIPGEALQGAAEAFSSNVGEVASGQRAPGELLDGIAANALMEGFAGGLMGGALGAATGPITSVLPPAPMDTADGRGANAADQILAEAGVDLRPPAPPADLGVPMPSAGAVAAPGADPLDAALAGLQPEILGAPPELMGGAPAGPTPSPAAEAPARPQEPAGPAPGATAGAAQPAPAGGPQAAPQPAPSPAATQPARGAAPGPAPFTLADVGARIDQRLGELERAAAADGDVPGMERELAAVQASIQKIDSGVVPSDPTEARGPGARAALAQRAEQIGVQIQQARAARSASRQLERTRSQLGGDLSDGQLVERAASLGIISSDEAARAMGAAPAAAAPAPAPRQPAARAAAAPVEVRTAAGVALPDPDARLRELRDLRKQRGRLGEAEANELADLQEADALRARVAGRAIPGVRNMKAYAEAEDGGQLKPVQAFADADNFKRFNDELGHDVGDQVISQMGALFAEALGEGNVFHRGGDEFVMQADSPEALDAALQQVREVLAQAEFVVELDDGRIIQRTGVGFSYGSGATVKEAENAQYADKEARKRAGLRTDRRDADAGAGDRGADRQREAPGAGRDQDPAARPDAGRAEQRDQLSQTAATAAALKTELERAGLPKAVGAKLVVVKTVDDLPADQRLTSEEKAQGATVEGSYDPATNTVYVVADSVPDAARAAWVMWHEVAGHKGLRRMLGNDARLDAALRAAAGNRTVRELAMAIVADRELGDSSAERMLAIEEALSELAAAIRTGNYAEIKARYDVSVPTGMRPEISSIIDRVVAALKNALDRVLGRQSFTDGQVRQLLEDAFRALRAEADAAEADGFIGDQPLRSRARSQRGQVAAVDPEIRYTVDASGAVTVTAGVEQARALLDERGAAKGVASRGTLRFTALQSPRVLAAFAGETNLAGRGGAVLQHTKNADGTLSGAPPKYNTTGRLAKLRAQLTQLAREGEGGRMWYEDSGRAVMRMVGGDVAEARKFIQLLAIYSPQADIAPNFVFALRAWTQIKAGVPVNVKTDTQDRTAERVVRDGGEWKGEKTNNFYVNLMRAVDPENYGPEKMGVTSDMWMMRAFEYDTDAPNASQYRFVEIETNRLARELGWEPQQAQAAIWVALKTRMNADNEANRRVDAASIAAGDLKMDGGVRTFSGKDGELRHRRRWFADAMKRELRPEQMAKGEYNYATALQDYVGQLSWEARPGRSAGGDMQWINDASLELQAEYQEEIASALRGDRGQDLLAEHLGLPVDSYTPAPGYWQGEVGASGQLTIALPLRKGVGDYKKALRKRAEAGEEIPFAEQSMVDPDAERMVTAYAAIVGRLLRQEGVGWHRPDYATTKRDANGVEVSVGRVLTDDEMRGFASALDARVEQAGANPSTDIAIIATPRGVRVLNFGAMPNPEWAATVQSVVESAMPASLQATIDLFRSDGNLISNDWEANPDGQDFLRAAAAAGHRPAAEWADRVLQPRIAEAQRRFAERHGRPLRSVAQRAAAGARQPRVRRDVPRGDGAEGPTAGLSGPSWLPDLPAVPASTPVFNGRRVQPDAVAAVGVHFSGVAGLEKLNPAKAGSGSAGGERRRFGQGTFGAGVAKDDTKRRLYFYAQSTDEIPSKEQAVAGQNGYRVVLTNLYDIASDPRGIAADSSNADMMEEELVEAGFDGFITEAPGGGIEEPVIVLFGVPKQVPVAPLLRSVARRPAPADDVAAQLDPDEVFDLLSAAGARVPSVLDAERRWTNGDVLFAEAEQSDEPVLIRDADMLRNYAQAEIMAVSREAFDEFIAEVRPDLLREATLRSTSRRAVTDTPAFRRWFGDSKVVDGNGDPLVVYHGTNAVFEEFKQAQRSFFGPGGIYFVDNADAGAYYAGQFADGGAVMPVYVSLQNPYVVDFDENDSDVTIEDLKARGFDGIIMEYEVEDGVEANMVVAFRPEQVKSATGNDGNFDAANPSILRSTRRTPAQANAQRQTTLNKLAAEGYLQGSNTWQATPKTKREELLTAIRRKMQDRMIDVRNAQEDIEAAIGRELDDLQNVYQAENLMYGKAADGIDQLQTKLIEPLQKLIKRAKIDPARIHEFLWAMHAQERNARIATINPGMPDGGSGMTNAEAAAKLAAFRKSPDYAQLMQVSRYVQAIRRQTIDTLVSSGQITPQLGATLKGMYQNYVPLRGKEGQGEARVGGGSRGIDSRGRPIERALGRGTPPLNILGELVGDAERAIVQGAKAEVGRTLLRAALANPNDAVWQVERVNVVPKYSEATGEVYMAIENEAMDENTIIVKHKGLPYRVRLNDPKLRDALTQVGIDGFEGVGRMFGWLNRWFSAVLTRYNPSFVPVNMIRDMFQGLTAVGSERGAKAVGEVAALYPTAISGLYGEARGRGDASVPDAQKTAADWAREFSESGGKTGWMTFADIETQQSRIENGMMPLGALLSSGKPIAAISEAARRSAVIQTIEQANDIAENGMRLANYIQMRKAGASPAKAAQSAKDLTVNFNRRGQHATAYNAAFLFYNAGVQGGHRVFKLLRDKRVTGMLLGLGSAQFALAVMAAAMRPGDDENEESLWERIPEHVKSRAFVIPLGFTDAGEASYVAIPMPYGFNLFPHAGGYAANFTSDTWLNKGSPAKRTTEDMARATIDAFSPIPLGESQWYLPTVLRMMSALSTNRDDLGRQITQSEANDRYERPRADMGRYDTPELYKDIAWALNALGGGDEFTKPSLATFLDRSPEDIEYLVNQFGGGIASNLQLVWRTSEKSAAGEQTTISDVPIASRVAGVVREPSSRSSTYYAVRDNIERGREQLRRSFANGGVEEFFRVREELGPAFSGYVPATYRRGSEDGRFGPGAPKIDEETGEVQLEVVPGSLADQYRSTERAIRGIAQEIRITYNDQTLSLGERRRRISELQQQRAAAMAPLTRAWNAAQRERP